MPKLKKPKRYRSQIPLLMSTDISGILALQPRLFYQLYQTISADCCPLDGVEFLPFRFSHHRVHHTLQKFNIPIFGIHGPLAWNTPDKNWFEKSYATFFASIMPNLDTTYKLSSQIKPNYLLFHEPDLAQCGFSRQLSTYLKQESTPTILLENVYRPLSLKNSVIQAQKLLTQTQAGVMIDLVHLLREVMQSFNPLRDYRHQLNPTNMAEFWYKMLWEMDRAMEQVPVIGFHLPIGTNQDSLPWELITPQLWQQLAKLLDKHQDRLVALTLENQHSHSMLSLNQKHLPAIIKDKKMKIKTLLQTRVL